MFQVNKRVIEDHRRQLESERRIIAESQTELRSIRTAIQKQSGMSQVLRDLGRIRRQLEERENDLQKMATLMDEIWICYNRTEVSVCDYLEDTGSRIRVLKVAGGQDIGWVRGKLGI